VEDYENFEFRSPLNPWNIQRQYKADYDKIKTLEIELTPGKIIYIPAYWWYSIKFMEPLSSVCVFKYRTYMNTVAILPKLCMKTLQRQNTKREIVKKVRFQKNEVVAKKVVEKERVNGSIDTAVVGAIGTVDTVDTVDTAVVGAIGTVETAVGTALVDTVVEGNVETIQAT
jgi:hypothetical protein